MSGFRMEYVSRLIDRFGYSDDFRMGLWFFIGGVMLMGRESEITELIEARNSLSVFDPDAEWKRLLGPLRDRDIQANFEEFVWRMRWDIELKRKEHDLGDGNQVVVEAYEWKNHRLLRSDDAAAENLRETADCLHALFCNIGYQLLELGYDEESSYQSGHCFFNIKTFEDDRATILLVSAMKNILPPIMLCCVDAARFHSMQHDEFLNIPLALHSLISGLNDEVAVTIWEFQSWVFYEGGKERIGIAELPINAFVEYCRTMAFHFMNEQSSSLRNAARIGGMRTVLAEVFDHPSSTDNLLGVVEAEWGYAFPTTKADIVMHRALVIYVFFCAMAEWALPEAERHKIN